MRSNPRIGQIICFMLAGISAGWLVTVWLGDELVAPEIGRFRHVLSYLALIVFFSSILSSVIFHNLALLRDNLLAGIEVISAWHVDRPRWQASSHKALADEWRQKRTFLYTIWIFIFLFFTAFAIFDRNARIIMLGIGLLLSLIMAAAYLIGYWMALRRCRYDDGRIIIGYKGMMANGVLHCWNNWHSQLVSASLDDLERPKELRIIYRQRLRSTEQEIQILVPVEPSHTSRAKDVVNKLKALYKLTP